VERLKFLNKIRIISFDISIGKARKTSKIITIFLAFPKGL
jgi:hypothetical protein